MPVPGDTTTKSLQVNVQKQKVRVKLRQASDVLVEGDLHAPIKKDETIYIIDTDSSKPEGEGRYLQLSLTKKVENWWPCAIQGDTEINRDDIRSEINTAADMREKLDPETRGFVEQMMHKTRQEMAGKSSAAGIEAGQERYHELQIPPEQ